MQKFWWQDRWSQDIEFIDPRVARLRRLAIKRRFIQHLPRQVLDFARARVAQLHWLAIKGGLTQRPHLYAT